MHRRQVYSRLVTRLALIAALAAGCGFTSGTGGLHSGLCPWPYEVTFMDPCTAEPPVPGPPLELATPGVYLYDTSARLLVDPTGGETRLEHSLEHEVHTVWLDGLVIASGVTLRAVGTPPLRIVSTTDIVLDGDIDISSHHGDPGAGSATTCPEGPSPGIDCTHGGSGGGGGGLGADGGHGGSGGFGRNCGFPGGNVGAPGGLGGRARIELDDLVGGCSGRIGGQGDGGPDDRGDGGAGGGGIQLVAWGVLAVNGTIHAGGAGGQPGKLDRAGAGGGGSGGMIQLDGSTVLIGTSAVLAANGGGGGGGCNDNNAECAASAKAGADGLPAATVAIGGAPAKTNESGTGGAGGYLMVPAENGTAPDRGGGGGGGGVGWIRITSIEREIGSAVMSPAVQ
jgi:hypothetical protein